MEKDYSDKGVMYKLGKTCDKNQSPWFLTPILFRPFSLSYDRFLSVQKMIGNMKNNELNDVCVSLLYRKFT